ncbi:MAG: hypothetical protein ABR962_02725 [Candidatus Bathyarchaeia archaeon]
MLKSVNQLNEFTCPVCGSKVPRNELKIAELNVKFLQGHSKGGTLDEALTILRIICEKVPGITIDASNKSALEEYFKKIQEEIARMVVTPAAAFVNNANQVMERLSRVTDKVPADISEEFLELRRELAEKLKAIEKSSTETPLTMFNELLEPFGEKLGQLMEKLPKEIREEFKEVKTSLQEQLVEVRNQAEKSSTEVSCEVKELRDTINKLIHKPTDLGRIGEGVLALSWLNEFSQDIFDSRGGPGEPDALVIPYLGMNGGDYGQRISLERKAGDQNYSGKHLEEASRHARKCGASQVMLIYDDRTNLPNEFRPIKLMFRPQQHLTIAVACLDERSWVTAREILEVLQITAPSDKRESIDLAELDKAIADIQAINAFIDKLRKASNAALRNCESVRTHLEELEESILSYQSRLRKVFEKETAKVITE